MKMLSTAEVYELVQKNDSLGEQVMGKIKAERIADPVLQTLWEEAYSILTEIEQYLEDNQDDFESVDDEEEEYD